MVVEDSEGMIHAVEPGGSTRVVGVDKLMGKFWREKIGMRWFCLVYGLY